MVYLNARILSILFLAASAGAGVPQDFNPWAPPSQPVYVVAPNNSSEGSGSEDTKFGDLLMVQIFPAVPEPTDAGARIDGKLIYKEGMLVALFVDGQRQGDVRVEAIKDHQCNSAAALVVPTAGALSRKTAGLATNADGIESHSGSRRNATASERNSVVQLVAREFLRHKVAASLMTRINVRSLAAIVVDDSKETTLLGSFFIQTKTERHDIFVIARANGSKLSLEYSRYGETTDLGDFKDHVTIDFVDHLDLNRDHSDEIVLRLSGYESEGYEIYARQPGKWNQVAAGGGAGC